MKNKQKAWRLGAAKWNSINSAHGGSVSARAVKELVGALGHAMRDRKRHRKD